MPPLLGAAQGGTRPRPVQVLRVDRQVLRMTEEAGMGSGTNRKWWRELGSRSGRKSGTKSGGRTKTKKPSYLKMKQLRAEAARRSNP